MSSRNARAEEVEQRLAGPVLVAALVSVPAVFLSTASGPTAVIGTVLNWASLAVLLGESVLLLVLSRDVAAWIRDHRWHLLVAGVTVPAVVFLVGPVQILRLVLSIGALRVLRAGRIVRAGRVLRRRLGWRHHRGRWLLGGATVLAAAFVTIVLADPTSRSRHVTDWVLDHVGVAPVLAAGLLLAVGTAVVVRYRRRS
ncbi:hypothetical protein B0I33_10489 [Prauserella shujinwangii]|uniref:Voltage-gated potassium channel n=1 Tax=Prauserella shujinwangii TaxID=1453103 RepID=A0A2T0LW76_9PSEU|nr:hypothetical protein [Prauserella shujinwangii]PRX48275.1 hypothetical protein B0I33_10489 [Prauserella shujinwangii]